MKLGKYLFLSSLLLLVFAVSGCASQNARQTLPISTPNETSGNSDSGQTGPADQSIIGQNVAIVNFAYAPAEITVKIGDTVTWTNEDSIGHTVTSDSGLELDSDLLSRGQSYSHTFTASGEYSYYCKPHPRMKGKVIVIE